MVGTLGACANRSTAAALASLYAYESQQPEVSRNKMQGLEEHYGVTSTKGTGYFAVHATLDLEHRAGERDALLRCLDQGATEVEVLAAATETLDAYWGLLDGVCEAAGIACMPGTVSA
jgi:pyrroloquinoline quinone (PQQ) biosynthesis protein C